MPLSTAQQITIAARAATSAGKAFAKSDSPRAVALIDRALESLGIARSMLSPQAVPASIVTVQEVFATAYGITTAEMMSAARPDRIAQPRQAAMAACRELLNAGLQSIGAAFGGRDHGTVIHAIHAVRDRCETYPEELHRYTRALAVARASIESLRASGFPLELPLTRAA